MDTPVNVQVDENEDTEWNDILRAHGIISPKPPSPTPLIRAALDSARDLAYANRLEELDVDELAALEEDEDEAFLSQHRAARLAELAATQRAGVFGSVYPISKPDYSAAVTDVSNTAFVFVLLTSGNAASRLLEEVWRELARKWAEVKFCAMRAAMCMEGYPDGKTPTVLVYRDGEIRRQVVGVERLGTGTGEWEGVMLEVGAVRRGDPRLEKGREEEGRGGAADDEDSDWD